MEKPFNLIVNKTYKINGPFGSTIFAKYIKESELAYHFCFENHNIKEYPGHVFKEDLEEFRKLNNL